VNRSGDGKPLYSSVGSGTENMGAAVDDLPDGASISVERRSAPRSAFTAAVAVVEPKSGTRIDAHTSDLSIGGCYVDTMNPFPEGTEVQLRLTTLGKSFNAKARVIYCLIGVGMGLRFITVGPEQLSILEKWFAELRGELQPVLLLADEEQPLYRATAKNEEHYILEELLVLMMRKGLLTEEEGEPILRRLLR
jgi:hypothetical protein